MNISYNELLTVTGVCLCMVSYSVKRSDVTGWKQGYITPPPPYFILWNALATLGENKVI